MMKKFLSSLRESLPSRLIQRRPVPATVTQVDLDRLLGTWFEVARLPNLEADGPGQDSVNVTATYTKDPQGRISAQTRANNAKAAMRVSEVSARVYPADASGSKLILSFYKLIRADLWVIGLDPDYRWVLLGTPRRRRLWLIAREPQIAADDYARAMAIASAQGYQADRVRRTRQQVAV